MFKALLLSNVILLSSCFGPSIQDFSLVEIETIASCSIYKISNSENHDYKLTESMKKALECPRVASIKNNILIYEDELDIRLHNLLNGSDHKIFTMHAGMDGLSNPAWSDDMTSILFLIVNQQKKHEYKSFTRLISLSLNEDFTVIKKEKYDRPVNFVCGSICTAIPYEDFYYEGTKIKYRRNTNIEDRPGIFEVIE